MSFRRGLASPTTGAAFRKYLQSLNDGNRGATRAGHSFPTKAENLFQDKRDTTALCDE